MRLKRIDEATLRQMYYEQKMSQEEIGAAIGADRHTVRDWMKYYGITARVTNQKRIDEATLRALYCDQGMTQEEVAAHLQVHIRSVRRWMKQYNIVHRPFSGEHNARYTHGRTAGTHQYRHAKPIEVCERCQATKNLCVHHVDFDHYNNHPDNLQILCVSCHRSVHKKAYWDAIKSGQLPPKTNAPIGWNK